MSKLTVIASGIISLLMLIGFVLKSRRHLTLVEILLPLSLLLIAVWPWFSFRFVSLYTPFLLTYLFTALSKLVGLIMPTEAAGRLRTVYAIAGGMLFVIVIDHCAYILGRQRVAEFPPPNFPLIFEESRTALSVLGHITEDDAVIGSDNPAQVSLYTNRRAVRRGQSSTGYRAVTGTYRPGHAGPYLNNRLIGSGGDIGVRYLVSFRQAGVRAPDRGAVVAARSESAAG